MIEEIPSGDRTISGVPTSIAAFVGRARSGPVNDPVTVNNFADFERIFGGLWADSSLGPAVQDFFQNGGGQAIVVRLYRAAADAARALDGEALQQDDFTGAGKEEAKEGLYALQKADLFNILCLPPYKDGDVDADLVGKAAKYCEDRRAMLLVDPPLGWSDKKKAEEGIAAVGTSSKNAALFFPRLRRPNPFRGGLPEDYVPCGAVAGVFARTDAQRGVWKAPAGLDATLNGVPELSVPLTDAENGELNPLGINCLRVMPAVGRVVWGARAFAGQRPPCLGMEVHPRPPPRPVH